MNIRDKILERLTANLNSWISGETLSRELEVSRTTISKHMQNLLEAGFELEKSTKKGYLLKELPDLLSAELIRQQLKTKILGQQEIHYYSELESTNNKAKELAAEGSPEGTIVIAETQSGGRGRKSRSWFSTAHKNLYFSLILRPKLAPSEAPALTLMTAVALAETIFSLTGLDIKIKWPNDILLKKLKLAGILTETSAEPDRIDYVVIGIGLNVNSAQIEFPEELNNIATSLYAASEQKLSRVKILQTFFEWFEKYYQQYIYEGTQNILKRFKEFSNVIGRQINVEMINKSVEGTVLDIDDHGVLVIEDSTGNRHKIFSGDLRIL